jgi:uncharacterized iron-regulated membrane protein
VSLPVLAWSLSGFLLAVPPGILEGEPYAVIEPRRVKISPAGAVKAVDDHLGKSSEITAISLEQRGQKATYSLFGKTGAFLVDAQTGELSTPPPPSKKTLWIRQAHFFSFAGPWKTALLMIFSLLSACSTLSGLGLMMRYLRKG